ncbi:MAG: UDP-N-acetylglucosamine 2-epimerase (non-hydrolyzing) [bacterium]
MRDIGVVIGTRPEAIKMMPVIRSFEEAGLKPKIFVTGQHRELLSPILSELNLAATENLDLMEDDQSLGDLSSRILKNMQSALRRHRPDLLLVQGDTTSAAMSALTAFYEDIRVAHIEAGLRTFNPRNPFPEEMNRRLVACLADIHFAPTAQAEENLLKEGIESDHIHVVGNTVVDALFYSRDHLVSRLSRDFQLQEAMDLGRSIVLVTGHRRESFGADLASICEGIRKIADEFKDQVEVIYPVHLNPNVQSGVLPILSSAPNVRLTRPLSYLRFIQVMLHSKLIITDSGGVQEEAAALGIPVLVTRRTCERLEAVDAGISQLVGPDAEEIFNAAEELLTNESVYLKRAVPSLVFGDGHASRRIVKVLLKEE